MFLLKFDVIAKLVVKKQVMRWYLIFIRLKLRMEKGNNPVVIAFINNCLCS